MWAYISIGVGGAFGIAAVVIGISIARRRGMYTQVPAAPVENNILDHAPVHVHDHNA